MPPKTKPGEVSESELLLKNLRKKVKVHSMDLDLIQKKLLSLDPKQIGEIVLNSFLEQINKVEVPFRTDFDNLQDLLDEEDPSFIESLDLNMTMKSLLIETSNIVNNYLDKLKVKESHVDPKNAAVGSHLSMKNKLPRIELSKFDGNEKYWLSFKSNFEQNIHNNTELVPTEKLTYLIGSVQAGALKLIGDYDITPENYEIAWDALCQRYHNRKNLLCAHFTGILDFKKINKASYTDLLNLYDTVSSHVRQLKTMEYVLEGLADSILVIIIQRKLDSETYALWSGESSECDMPKYSVLMKFIERRAKALKGALNQFPEVCSTESRANQKSGYKNKPIDFKYNKQSSFTALQSSDNDRKMTKGTTYHKDKNANRDNSYSSNPKQKYRKPPKCHICEDFHFHINCPVLNTEPNANKRRKMASDKNLCLNCLNPNHSSEKCPKAFSCKSCNKRHNTLFHGATTSEHSSVATNSVESMSGFKTTGSTEVIMFTAKIKVQDKFGKLHYCRAMFDNGSQCSLITSSFAKQLCLPVQNHNTEIIGVGNDMKNQSPGKVNISFGSRFSNDLPYKTELLIMSQFKKQLPSHKGDTKGLELILKQRLADPDFYKPSKIDILFGIKVWLEIMQQGKYQSITIGSMFAQNSPLGFIVAGELSNCAHNLPKKKRLFSNFAEIRADTLIEKFWELDKVPETKARSLDDQRCESHFETTFSRNKNGRYIVRLPFKRNPSMLGNTRRVASKQYKAIEAKLRKNSEQQAMYSDFMSEYLKLNHMSRIDETERSSSVFLPHHPVFKQERLTSKLRVVFNASLKSSTGLSLNDILYQGPPLQSNLVVILTRFRFGKIAVSSDIEKMYRQFLVHQDDRKYQQILWRKDNKPFTEEIYQLNTVTYGTACAAYLAIKCLHQLAHDEREHLPEACNILKNNFYVDDLLVSFDSLNEAKDLVNQMSLLVSKGGMTLRKWASNNSQAISQTITEKTSDDLITIKLDSEVKTLGILWDTKADSFSFKLGFKLPNEEPTKRSILSVIARLYDPLGWLSPFLIAAKLVMQTLWKINIDWDSPLIYSNHPQLMDKWSRFLEQLSQLNRVSIPRWFGGTHISRIQIHGFCDASQSAYAAALYVRCMSSDNIHVNLIASKTKVAPIKALSIPRLELCSALLLSKLAETLVTSLPVRSSDIYFWTDSTIVLAWLADTCTRWKTFVANRISKIQRGTSGSKWLHICGELNPADVASRGVALENLINDESWWHGPPFLKTRVVNLDQTELILDQSEEVEKEIIPAPHSCFLLSLNESDFIKKSSSLRHLKLSMAYITKFAAFLRHREAPIERPTVHDLHLAFMSIIRHVQLIAFGKDIELLNANRELNKQCLLYGMNPYLDHTKVMRVRGRLHFTDIPESAKYPIILPKDHHLTTLILKDIHETYFHAGCQLVMFQFSLRFFTFSLRRQVKSIIDKCLKCFIARPKFSQPSMGYLPSYRFRQVSAFFNSGVDYAGPFMLKPHFGRKTTRFKTYVVIFVCMSTRAIHLEVVLSLTTSEFFMAMSRFIARRGRPKLIVSDNGSNFVGANNKLKDLYQFLRVKENAQQIISNAEKEQIQWVFNPPSAPNFGGIWEAGVKSFKHHLTRTIGDTIMNLNEFYTLLTRIEAVLNSRPLMPQTDLIHDLEVLTPGHFLVGGPLKSFEELDHIEFTGSLSNRFKMINQKLEHFWKLWHGYIISHLQSKPKWKGGVPNLKLGDLVLISHDHKRPLLWKKGRVTGLFPGPDNIVRVAELKTSDGLIKRPTSKLAVLPVEILNA